VPYTPLPREFVSASGGGVLRPIGELYDRFALVGNGEVELPSVAFELPCDVDAAVR